MPFKRIQSPVGDFVWRSPRKQIFNRRSDKEPRERQKRKMYMSFFEKAKGFYESKKKPIIAIGSSVLAVLFVASVVIAVFCGGEFTQKDEKKKEVKGLLQIVNASYSVSYLDGDSFSFDKQTAEISLIARDPAFTETVKIPKLPATEYGFKVNGEGEFISEPEQITMTKDVKTVRLVSKLYQNIGKDIEVTVVDKPDIGELTDKVLIEAEAADLYAADGKLLTDEEKRTLPNADKPYISSAGTDEKGTDCSGGAALRNFSSGMKVQFKVYSDVNGEADFTILTCQRPNDTEFDTGYVITVNSTTIKTGATVPGLGKKEYFTPYTLPAVKITLKKGLNVITFAYGTESPCNLDAVKIETAEAKTLAVLGGAVTPETPDEPKPEEPKPEEPKPGEFVSELLLEAEAAELYTAEGKLLTDEEKRILPDTKKPYISSAGSTVAGTDCSGGAALRNFSSGMKVIFKFNSEVEKEVDFIILTCKRPDDANFDTGYVITVNSTTIKTNATVPGLGKKEYFTPYTLPAVKITLKKGLNVITFAYGEPYPCNLDAIKIVAADKILSVPAANKGV